VPLQCLYTLRLKYVVACCSVLQCSHSYVCVTCLIRMCVSHVPFVCVCDMSHSYVCDMTHSYVCMM